MAKFKVGDSPKLTVLLAGKSLSGGTVYNTKNVGISTKELLDSRAVTFLEPLEEDFCFKQWPVNAKNVEFKHSDKVHSDKQLIKKVPLVDLVQPKKKKFKK